MTEKQPKKMIILDILHIMQKYTDKDHPLSQHRIQELLEKEYNMKTDRKTVKRNLSQLIEFGYPIYYKEFKNIRINNKGEEETILTDWYYEHDFTEGELRLLIDSVLFADALTQTYRRDLVRKLENLSNHHFHSAIKKIDMSVYNKIENGSIFLTEEILGKAIADERKVSFHYNDCGTDFKLHLRLSTDGTPKLYVVNPYQLITANGHTYLIGNNSNYDELTHFRLDRITDIKLTDKSAKPLRNITGFENGLKLSEYISQHPNLWSGEPAKVVFRCPQYFMNDVADWFGTKVRVDILPDNMAEVHVKVSESSMLYWAVQYSDKVEVISPQSLRNKIAETLKAALKKYES